MDGQIRNHIPRLRYGCGCGPPPNLLRCLRLPWGLCLAKVKNKFEGMVQMQVGTGSGEGRGEGDKEREREGVGRGASLGEGGAGDLSTTIFITFSGKGNPLGILTESLVEHLRRRDLGGNFEEGRFRNRSGASLLPYPRTPETLPVDRLCQDLPGDPA